MITVLQHILYIDVIIDRMGINIQGGASGSVFCVRCSDHITQDELQ
jgi:hypothetical protein